MVSDRTQRNIRRVAELIAKADALLITAGAGMGVDSGLPDYRGRQGFWRGYPVLEQRGFTFEQMAQPAWFVLPIRRRRGRSTDIGSSCIARRSPTWDSRCCLTGAVRCAAGTSS